MKFLVAIVLLAFAVAEAHHTALHSLRSPRFKKDYIYKYDVEFNVTSGVLGLSSQVSKSAIKATVSIYTKNEKEHILKIEKVLTSGSLKTVEGKHVFVPMYENRKLEDRLSAPIKFTLVNGEVTSYTLSSKENLESKKIKKSILRSLEMHVPETTLQKIESNHQPKVPLIYNTTEVHVTGVHTTRYVINVSPYPEFPATLDVYNITRSEDFEGQSYPSYHMHHNFHKQGCPEVCRNDWENNEYGAGCPVGYELHHTPVKMSLTHEHHLSLINGIMNPEIIKTTEVHVANMYDQDMEVLIMYEMRRTGVSRGSIVEPPKQQTYTDLKDLESEINEKEIDAFCDYKSSNEAIESAQRLLNEISRYIVNGDLEDSQTSLIGEKIILLKKVLMKLSVQELKKILVDITTKRALPRAKDVDKVKRQIWLDILPLIGTEASVTFMVEYIKERAISDLMAWEVKEMLEALPQNIHAPSERNIRELWSLIQERGVKDKMMKNHLLHSAIHVTLSRVIREICSNASAARHQTVQETSWHGNYQHIFRSAERSRSSNYGVNVCSEGVIMEIIQEFTENVKHAQKKEDIAVYLESLSQMGVPEVLPVISEYVYGTADNMQAYSSKLTSFFKTVAINSLHNVIENHPQEVLSIVLPVYINRTEPPRVRNAAFNVIMKCQPSLSVLQEIAVHSWAEESKEVGSFVTSTLETFGNSSLPCMQLTAHRIKKVLPQFKRFDIGLQHSKNFLWNYFDEQRDFGLENHLKYILSNESIFPSTLYHSISYFSDSLKDVLIQMNLNIEGLTQEKVMEKIESYLGVPPVRHFDKNLEKEIFGQATLLSRVPEKLRFALYKKIFYSTTYNYFDSESENVLMRHFLEYITTYLKPTHLDIEGCLVKMFIPSSFHTKSIARTLPYPVEFEMKQPLVFALHVKSLEKGPTARKFHLRLRPSVYATKLYTNQMKNIGDCKEIGVYHEHKVAASYPFEIKFEGIYFPNVTIKYKMPELQKKVLTYFSEAGTYAGKMEFETLPTTVEREPIETLPSPFEIEKEVNLVGVPPLRVQLHTEEIGLLTENHPRSVYEALDIVVRKLLNAGWRRKSINITALEDSRKWPAATEVTFTVRYSRDHITRNKLRMNSAQYGYQWGNGLQPQEKSQWSSQSWFWKKRQENEDEDSDITYKKDYSTIKQKKEKTVADLIAKPHITHLWKVQIETQPVYTTAYIELEYNHTHSKLFHSCHVNAAVRPIFEEDSYEVHLHHVMRHLNVPNEFRYDTHSEKQTAEFVTSLALHKINEPEPSENAHIMAVGILKYESLEKLLKNELHRKVDSKYYLPETHEQCLKDVEEGKCLSKDCIKAIRERSIYNNLDMSIIWNKELPEILTNLARRVDIYAKHYLFHHMNLTYTSNTEDSIKIVSNHIDKFTDTPVFDMKIQKPNETVELRRVPTGGLQPLSSVYGHVQTILMEATNNTYPPTCVMMEKYVKTYDMMTYPFSPERCRYVLSAHCAEYKNFAVLAKGIDKRKGTKEIEIYVGNAIVILTPRTGKEYTIKFNGQDYTVGEPILLDDSDAEIYAYTVTYDDDVHLYVRARKAGIRVQYDGVNVKVVVDPRYKGELCGLCSEFDGDELREYRGLDRCLYTHPLDFANTAITHPEGGCEKNTLMGKKMCGDNEDNENVIVRRYKAEEDDDEEDFLTEEPVVKRNIVITRGNKFCFSTLPVPVCNNHLPPSETESRKIAFHCLPKRDHIAKKLLTESKSRVLEEMASEEPDFEEIVEVPTMC